MLSGGIIPSILEHVTSEHIHNMIQVLHFNG